MRTRYFWLSLALALVLLTLFATALASAQGTTPVIHQVRPGETLSGIARLYGVTPEALASANGILNPNLIFVGQRLVIPTPTAGGEIIHVVARGETLYSIARRYGVDPARLATYNGISDPNRIRVGQRLRIPAGRPTATPRATATVPAPRPTATPTPAACPCEEFVIFSPTQGMTVTSPVTVVGLGSGFEQTVVVAVLDAAGGRIGLAPATVVGEYGQQGTFTATVPFTLPANSQPGRIQVWSESPRDGAIEHLNSVTVMLQGLDLDPLLTELEKAVRAKDYAALEKLIGDRFRISFYKADGEVTLTLSEALAQLQQGYLGPGAAWLDFSVNARALLGDRVTFGPEVIHVVYSPGWGANQDDDAFLLIGDVRGRARWVGMLYVRHDLIDYR